MSKIVKIALPKLGESIVSASVVQWFKKVGDLISLDESLLEVSTDKVNSEIPSPVAGVLKEICVKEGVELQVGETLALIETEISLEHKVSSASENRDDLYTPSVLRLLKEKGISLSDARHIPHTGEGGRLTKKDVEQYQKKETCPFSKKEGGSTERVKMSPMRKAIAENMVKSFYEAPHASLITEVDITEVLKLIQKEKQSFLEKHQAKLTITAFVARAIAKALEEYPLLNASLEEDTIIVKRSVNLGIAVSVDQGVMVPVIKDCGSLSLIEIAKQISSLAEKTRSHRLQPDDTQGGSITMTNFGMTGTLIGIPIIRHPEVAIIGLGAMSKKVSAMPDDSIAIRSKVFVSLTFDHRVLDGIYGCSFLSSLQKHLEEDLYL